MATKTILIALGIVLLGILQLEIEAADNGSVSIAIPDNRRIKGLGAKKCLLYMWDGVCENQNCTVKIDRALSKEGGNKVTATVNKFKPFTKDNTQAVCFYDSTGENSTCCNEILSGANDKAQSTPFGDYDRIAFTLERERLGKTIKAKPDSFLLPWKDLCLLKKPCKTYGTCKAEKPNTYNCTCKSNWKGDNCTERTGWVVSVDRCLKDAKDVKLLRSPISVDGCIKQCEDMNKDKIGCKSFQFNPDSAGSSHGSCTLYDVSKIHDGKELASNCVTWYFDLEKLPKIKPSIAATSSASVLFLAVLYIAHMAFLHL